MGIFIEKLPKNLSISIQGQYDFLFPVFKSYANSESKQFYALVGLNFEVSCLFFEMALFYKNIVLPLSKGSDAFVRLNTDKFSKVKIGGYTLTSIDRRRIRDMEKDFEGLLSKFNIPLQLLLFSDIKDFTRNLNQFYEQYE